jgi:small subunit ribosomal protein S11
MAKKKKITRRISGQGRIYIQSTFNNTLITVTDEAGEVLAWASSGNLGFKGARKATPFAATTVAKNIIEKSRNLGVEKVRIFVKGIGTGRDAALRAIQSSDLDTLTIADVTPIPHNGCRAKRPRRV